jgi:hypothetical protein
MLYFLAVIDWFSVAVNSLWILGLAILLASFSYHYWLATEEKRPFRAQFSVSSFLIPVWLGFSFIGLGLVGTSQSWWETGIWTFFTLLSLYNLFTLVRRS